MINNTVVYVRWFVSGDADGMVALHSKCSDWFEDLSITREFVLSVSQRSDFRIAVAEDSGAVVGFAGVLFHEAVGRAEMGPVAVLPDYRGLGVGGSLLDFLLRFLRERGVRRVVVIVKSFNRDALFFFIGRGFVFEAFLRRYTVDGEDAVQLVLFLD